MTHPFLSFGHVAHVWGDRPLEAVAEGVVAVGYSGIEFFDHRVAAYLDRPGDLGSLLEARQLRLASLYLEGAFMERASMAEAVERVGRWAAFVAGLGCRQLVVGPGWSTGAAPADGYDVLVETLEHAGTRARASGVDLCFHPHMGSAVQSRDQIGRVFDRSDPALVHFCLDTAHVAKGGSDLLEIARTYSDRIKYVHVKDLDEQGRFTELGRGRLDHLGLFRLLRDAGYGGWVLPEVPVSAATHSSAEEVAAADLAYLRQHVLPLWATTGATA